MLPSPVVKLLPVEWPKQVFEFPVMSLPARKPTAVLLLPPSSDSIAPAPTAVLSSPVVLSNCQLAPRDLLRRRLRSRRRSLYRRRWSSRGRLWRGEYRPARPLQLTLRLAL